MFQPLTGLRVLDFGRFIAAPYCGMLLADLGADVIRIERPEGGEDRAVGPVTEQGEGGLFLNLNRNKRGITLNLGHEAQGEVVSRLVADADVLLVNLPKKLQQRVGLDYETVRAAKADIVHVSATAFGMSGPYADRVGFDTVAQAMSGAMSLTGFPPAPVRSIVPFADYGTALHAAFGVAAALYQRSQTGEGCAIQVSLLATSLTFMQPFLCERAATERVRGQQGNQGYYTAPSNTYQTRDGWIMVPTVGEWMFKRWTNLVGCPELVDDDRFQDDLSRADHGDVIDDLMSAWCGERTTDEVLSACAEARLPAGPVYDLDQVLADPHVASQKWFHQVAAPSGAESVPLTRTALETGGKEAASTATLRPAPRLGQHTDEVLAEAGFSAAEIARLRADQVI